MRKKPKTAIAHGTMRNAMLAAAPPSTPINMKTARNPNQTTGNTVFMKNGDFDISVIGLGA